MDGVGEFSDDALEAARFEAIAFTETALAEAISGRALAAECLDYVVSLPFPELRWAALGGVAAALRE